jgi:CRISPR/Cas system-associated protein Cas10 (large subunit of type III CRISPR-Cas system)
MPFSEHLKLTVKQKANFTCCWCQEHRNKVDVHHIIPESDGGPDTEDNAAPLCGSCHALYGNNPDLRKEIRSRRDHWYEYYAGGGPLFKEDATAAPLSQSEQMLGRVAEIAGKLTEALSSGCLQGYSEAEARQMLSELYECRGRLREHAGLLQGLRELENSIGWLLSRKGLFETVAERKETLVELEQRYQAVITEVRRLPVG